LVKQPSSKPIRADKLSDAERGKRLVEPAKEVAPSEEPDDFDWVFDMKPKAKSKP
jgi:hypothetical protein